MEPTETNPLPESPEAAAEQPLVLIPVSAEEHAAHLRRMKLSIFATVVLVLAAAGYIYKRSVDPIHAQESFDSGERLYRIARYSQAILSFERAIDLRPDFADAYYLRGKAFQAESKSDSAVRDYTKVIALRPSDTRPLLDRASVYLIGGNIDGTVADATRAIAINPKLAEAYNLRGTAMRTKGDLKAALADFNHAVELDANLDNYYQRGATYQLLNQHPLAIADFDQAIEIAPSQAQTYFARAESRRAVGDAAGADKDHLRGRILDGR